MTTLETMAYRYLFTVASVIDGDTVDGELDQGFGTFVRNKRLRLAGYDTPERTHPWYREAREHLLSLLPVGTTALVVSTKSPRGSSTNSDSFNRFVSDLYVEDSESIWGFRHINDQMISSRYGMIWDDTTSKMTNRWECWHVDERGNRCDMFHFDKTLRRCVLHGGPSS